MYYSKCNVGYVLRLETGEEIQETLRSFAEHVELKGAFYQGIGSLSRAELCFYRPQEMRVERAFIEEEHELIFLMGNLSILDDMPTPHSHVSLSDRNHRTIAGHLLSGFVSVTAEILVTVLDLPLTRTEDPLLKFKVLSPPKPSRLKIHF
jgi:predicted DNA-binding protein with PD1-like motif